MSTKQSIGYEEFTIKKSIHIYKESLDDTYYIEDEKGNSIKLPNEEIAVEFSKIIEKSKKDGN